MSKKTLTTTGLQKATTPLSTNINSQEQPVKRTNFDLVAVGVCPKDKINLKDIAKRIGVSPSYLSQVRHGKRPMSDEIKQKLSNLGIEKLSKIKQSDRRDDTNIEGFICI